jgi:pilus assembly protein CpaC
MTIKSMKSALTIICNCFTLAAVLCSFQNAHAENLKSLNLLLKQGQLIQLPQAAKAIFIANPEIASYQAPSSQSLFIFGQSAGITTLYVLGQDEKVIYARTIQVTHDVDNLSKLIKQQFPASDVSVISTANRLILTGSVSTPEVADKIAFLSQGYLSDIEAEGSNPELINQLSINLPTQVNIRVRIAEMDRETAREFGFDTELKVKYAVSLKTINPFNNSLSVQLKALEAESLISILAEPNLTAVSGEQAQFLAGGQFPIFITGNNGEITIEYRDYGVALDITPTILSPERISLQVKPSVSELSDRAVVQVNGFTLPGLTTRSASTTVELASGQSFILGGLIHERENTVISEIPFLADIPILGALFRSEKYSRKETELVIIATAYIVEPSRENNLHIPQHGMEPYDHWQRYLYGRILKPNTIDSNESINGDQPKIVGDYGFIF